MESCLGSVEFKPSAKTEDVTNSSSQTALADFAAEETEALSTSGRGIARMYWEGVESGKVRSCHIRP